MLGRHEQQRIYVAQRVLERARDGRIVGVVVVAVERQVLEVNLLEGQSFGRQLGQSGGELSVDRCLGETANEDIRPYSSS